ncbi:MAG: HAD family hydrolase [Candidatus Lindowbacteria bacterium]|nr:HAD family hydrolase [Candidatus Lindowbacteria bacterium]
MKVVFFDFGDTLMEGNPSYLRRITDLLGGLGFECAYTDVVRAFDKADYLVYLDSRSGSLSGDGEYLMRFLDHLGRLLQMSIDWPSALPRIMRKFDEKPYVRTLSEGVVETLEGLREKGYRLGVISNNDGRCREKCAELGIAQYFETIVDSSLEGVRKPSPKIFEIALERMTIPRHEAAHVGDMYGSDVLGARDAGITPVWYNPRRCEPFDSYRPDHDIVRFKQLLDIF